MFPLRAASCHDLLTGNGDHLRDVLPGTGSFLIYRAAVARLEQFKNFIIAHLQIPTARLGDICRIRPVQHAHTVLFILYPQTPSEFCVAPDVIIHSSLRFLCRQDQMYPKASSHLRHTDQLFHEIRLFPFQLRKLINDDEQMGNGHCRFSVFIQPGIAVDVVHTVVIENLLPPPVFTFDRYHGTMHLIARQIGNLPCQMRQIRKQVRHTAALEINDEKGHVVRAEIHSQVCSDSLLPEPVVPATSPWGP